jgi:hypothetical protein
MRTPHMRSAVCQCLLIQDPCNDKLRGILVRLVAEELATSDKSPLYKELLTLTYEA